MTGHPASCLVVLRHGESEWNASNQFAGWVNVALTAAGEAEAARAGGLLAEHGLLPGVVHTSVQQRTIRAAAVALAECD
jgi:2,3-bisphosphoglycerate-dependent phosphoglycerate mutase